MNENKSSPLLEALGELSTIVLMMFSSLRKFFEKHISYQAVILLSIISFSTSYYGFLSLVSDGMLLTKVLFFAVVAVIQIALVYSISELYMREFFSRHIFRASLLLSTYVLSLFISVLFSFNFYYKIFSASQFSQRNVTLQLEGIKERLENAESSFDSIYSSLKGLSDYSQRRSFEESRVGGTCDETKIPTPGPRSALRQYESELFASHLSSVGELKEKMSLEIQEVKGLVKNFNPKRDDIEALEEQVNKRIGGINRIFREGEITLLPKVLLAHRGTKRMQMLSKGQIISCPDSKISQKINTIIENLNSLQFLKKVSFFDANDQQQLIERTINVLLAVIPFTDTKVVAIDKVSSPTDVTQSDVKAIGLGFLVDFFIFFFTILSKEPYRARFFTEMTIREYQRFSLRRTLKPFIFEGHFFYHLIIPNQKRNIKLDEIVTKFQVDKMLTLTGTNVDYSELLLMHQVKLKNFEESTFQVYKLKKRKYETLVVEIDKLV